MLLEKCRYRHPQEQCIASCAWVTFENSGKVLPLVLEMFLNDNRVKCAI